MNKKIIRILPFVATAMLACACSDDNPTDPGTGDDPSANLSSAGITNPDDPFGVASSSSVTAGPVDPNSGAVQPGQSSAQQPGVSSSSVATPVSSSNVIIDLPQANFLPAAGFYTNLTINPPSATQGGQVKCTFDGSIPTANSESISAAKQITQNTVVRCSEFVNGQAINITTQTYFINEKVSMPVVALTVNHHDMFDSTDGLYATGNLTNNQGGMIGGWDFGGGNATDQNNSKCTEPCKQANFWKEDELPVHVEYFENGSSTTEKNWEVDAGISIIGNYSRYKPKKSVAIKLDNDDYGSKSIKYSLFKTRPETKKFKSFNLRNNGNRFWTDYFGDAMLTSLMEGTDVDYQRSRQVVVFYNGEYFGIHDMRERLNRSFAETNYGIDKSEINVVKNCSGNENGCQSGWQPSGTNGASSSEFVQVVNTVNNGNFEGENNQSYNQLKEKLNVNSFAQYMLAEMYIHNGDWPGNNVRFWGGNGHPFKAMIFDVDHGYGFSPGITGFDTESHNMFSWVLGSTTMDNSSSQGETTTDPNAGGNAGGFGGFGGGNFGGGNFGGWGMGGASSTIGQMLQKLLKNPDFKRLFINQACILLNDYLTYEKVQSTVQSMLATMPSSERTRDEQRWPRNQTAFTWQPEGTQLLQFARNRTETFRQEVATYFGLSGEANVTISAGSRGTVLVDGMKLPSTNYTGKFFSGTTMELTAVPGDGAMFSGWSDGSTENPHIIQVNGATTITAQFK